ncbi:MAG: DMT family transporter [Clostridia bacterium]|nr:DMT family transporter [Clostridia bacterium]
MNKERRLNIISKIILLLITIAWGSSFIILKETIDSLPIFYVLALRFLPASIILFLILIAKIKDKLNKKSILHGVIIGLILFSAYAVQTIGVKYTTASRNAFLTASYCVLTPFLAYFINKTKIQSYNVISAILCLTGVGFVVFSSGIEENSSSLLLGDFLTLGCAIFYALQIIMINKYQNINGDDGVVLLVFELLTAGVCCTVTTLIFELPTQGVGAYSLNIEQILKIGYLMLVCTLFAQLGQMLGQKYTEENEASLILSLEAFFGAVFAVLIGDEKFSILLVIGFIIIFIAEIINELKIDVLKPLKRLKR